MGDSAWETQTYGSRVSLGGLCSLIDSLKKCREVGGLDQGGAGKAHLDRSCGREEDYILEGQSFGFGVTVFVNVVLLRISQ